MQLTTRRLLVRPWALQDVDRMFDIHRRPEVVRWLGTPVVMAERTEAVARIERYAALEDPPLGYWAIEVQDTGVVAGSVLLLDLPHGGVGVQVGWYLHPDSQGHGYASEAARAVLDRGMRSGLPQVHALTDVANAPSRAVCRRLGMTDLGVIEGDSDRPSQCYRITAEEWATALAD